MCSEQLHHPLLSTQSRSWGAFRNKVDPAALSGEIAQKATGEDYAGSA